jgi:hypothetical protein
MILTEPQRFIEGRTSVADAGGRPTMAAARARFERPPTVLLDPSAQPAWNRICCLKPSRALRDWS